MKRPVPYAGEKPGMHIPAPTVPAALPTTIQDPTVPLPLPGVKSGPTLLPGISPPQPAPSTIYLDGVPAAPPTMENSPPLDLQSMSSPGQSLPVTAADARPTSTGDFNVVGTSQVIVPSPTPAKSDNLPATTAPRHLSTQVSSTSGNVPARLVPPSYSTDHRTLTGQVQSWRGSWRLRYTDIGVEDQYGGSVTLEGVREQLQEGNQVRIHGQLIPPVDRLSPPRFQVQSLEVLSK